MGDYIYLDNNATTRPLESVVEAMLPLLRGEQESTCPVGGELPASAAGQCVALNIANGGSITW